MALKGIKVIELAGLAPAPFCGMILADFGASIIKVDKIDSYFSQTDCLYNGKECININLKNDEGANIVKKLSKNCDVLIDPFRAGVMERLGLGPEILLKENKRLVFARLSGFGQKGYYSPICGHDLNFIGISGLLSLMGWYKNAKPVPPLNLLGDFASGGLLCALGIMMALFEREKSGLGQVVDCSMVHGSIYLGSWIFRSKLFENQKGTNLLDGGYSFYDTYETKDGKYMAVASIEPQFYHCLLQTLGLSEDEYTQYSDDDKLRAQLTELFKKKTQDEWCNIFDEKDACVTPVLTPTEAMRHRHNVESGHFLENSDTPIPKPAPILSRTPGETSAVKITPTPNENIEKIMLSLGYSKEEIQHLLSVGVLRKNNL